MQTETINGMTVRLVPEPTPVIEVTLVDGDKIRVKQAALIMGITRMTLDNWLDAGKMTKFRRGSCAYVSWAEVKAKLAEGYGREVRPVEPKKNKQKSAA